MTIDLNSSLPIEELKFNRIFLLSDIHFGIRVNSLEWLENQQRFFKEFYIPYIKKTKKQGDVLFILGDWFDSRQLLDIYVMNTSIDIINELSSIIPVKLLTGNHDIYKKYETDVNSLRVFEKIKGVKIYDKPTIIKNDFVSILLIPWIGDKKIEEDLINSNKTDYVFAHFDMSGFKYDNGRDINKGVDFKSFSGKRIISGHIHKRQESTKHFYLGSPYHTKRSDIGNKKGIYVLDPNTDKVEFVENTISPIYQKINLRELLNLKVDVLKQIFDNNYTDIIVADKWIHTFNLTKFIELLSGCNYKKVEICLEKKLENTLSDAIEDTDIKDIFTLLDNCIDELKIEPEEIKKLKQLNKAFYEKASKEEIS